MWIVRPPRRVASAPYRPSRLDVTTCPVGVALVLVGLVLAGCGRSVPPIHADAESVRELTVPPGGRLGASTPLTSGPQSARASWRVETQMEWSEYASWVEASLHEFRVAQRSPLRLRLSRQLQGDLYMVELAAVRGASGLTVEVSFVATPF